MSKQTHATHTSDTHTPLTPPERADALAENEDLKSQLLTLSEEADESAQTSDSMAQSVWRGRYEALLEANESLKEHNATLQQAVKDSRTSPVASPVASPPPSTTSATPDLELSKLRKQISTLTRQNRQLEREKARYEIAKTNKYYNHIYLN